MRFESKPFTLKNGTQGVFKTAEKADAPLLLQTLIRIAETSPYILQTPATASAISIEDEEKWIEKINATPNSILITAHIGSQIVGITNFSALTNPKNQHRGSLGTSVHPNFQGMRLGFQMMSFLLENIRTMNGIKGVELNVMAPNVRAISLYKKLGFSEVGRKPNAYLMDDGSYVDDIAMQLWLDQR